MPLTVRLISKRFIFCFFILLTAQFLGSCTLEPVVSKKEKVIRKLVNQKVFFASYDNVWRAAQLALKYPIAINNMDNGILESEFVRAEDGFSVPKGAGVPSAGVRYKITLVLVKGKVDGKESVRVTINKVIEKKRDFFSDPEVLATDGLEEMVIFYRIGRELIIDEALKKAAKEEAK